MKIAYCGYDFFHSCLKYLIDAGHEIEQIFTFPCDGRFNFNHYITELATTHNIPVTEKPVTSDNITTLAEQGVDCIISAGYSYKIPSLENSPIKGINIHPTLLPMGRGVWPLPHIILKKLTESGVSLHKINDEWDAGDILAQESYLISNSENLETLSIKTQLLAAKLLKQVIEALEQKWQQATPQHGEVSSWPMPGIADRYIRWDMRVEEIDRICRAFGKFSALAIFDGVLWNIYELSAWQEQHSFTPGQKIHMTNTETVIAASDGLVCLRYFQQCDDQTLIDEL